MIDQKYPQILISNDNQTSDSANHTVYYNIMRFILGQEHEDCRYLFFDEETGLAKRHPDRETNSFTRDQFTPFIAYEAMEHTLKGGEPLRHKYASFIKTWSFYLKVKRNFFFFNDVKSNGEPKKWYERDFLDPQTRALWARATGTKRWMHYIGDINLALTILHKDWFKPDHSQDENIHCHLIVSKLVQPTFISKWNWNYYFYKTKKPWQKKIFDFFDRGGTYYPEIIPVAIEAIDKLLEEKWK